MGSSQRLESRHFFGGTNAGAPNFVNDVASDVASDVANDFYFYFRDLHILILPIPEFC